MSTNATIAMAHPGTDTIEYIYLHWDGYIHNGAGETLAMHYTTPEKVKKLMALGDLSILGTEPIDFPDGWKPGTEVPDDRCLSYAARGESSPSTHLLSKVFWGTRSPNQEFNYYFDADGQWWYWCDNGSDNLRKLLPTILDHE
jgi:hypothetical protein